VVGLCVRRRVYDRPEPVGENRRVGSVLGPHLRVNEDGRGVEQPGWVVVRWHTGGSEPIHVNDLQLGDDTHDFLRRVYSHHVGQTNFKDATGVRIRSVRSNGWRNDGLIPAFH